MDTLCSLFFFFDLHKQHYTGAKSVIRKILEKDPVKRFGCGANGPVEIMQHEWFKNFNWDDLEKRKMKAPELGIPKLKKGEGKSATFLYFYKYFHMFSFFSFFFPFSLKPTSFMTHNISFFVLILHFFFVFPCSVHGSQYGL